jgi:ABC-type lipoprotein release transport system permease subunit
MQAASPDGIAAVGAVRPGGAGRTLAHLMVLAWRQAWRHRRRTMLIGFCVALSNVALIFQMAQGRGQQEAFMHAMIHSLSGHLQLAAAAEDVPVSLFAANIQDVRPLERLDRIEAMARQLPHVRASTRRIRFGGMISRDEDNWNGFLVGVQPDTERSVCDAIGLAEGRFVTANQNEIVIGSASAREHGLKIGDSVTVLATTASRSFNAMELKIVGLLSEAGLSKFYSKLAYIPLDRAQRLIGVDSDQAYELVLALDQTENTDSVARALTQGLGVTTTQAVAVRDWRDMGGIFIGILEISTVFRGAMLMFLGVVVLILVFSSFSVYVMEREIEIATLLALGLRKADVGLLFIAEAMIVAALAALLGLGIGGAISFRLGKVGIPAFNEALVYVFGGERLYPIVAGSDLLWLFAGSIGVAAFAAILPVQRALGKDFARSLNRN